MTETSNLNDTADLPATPVAALLAPDVGALVEYGMNGMGTAPARYRVSGWIRPAPPPKVEPGDFLSEMLFEVCQEIRDKRDGQKKRMQFCLREEATHLALSGVCGAIAPIEMCKVTGIVPWTEEHLDRERAHALRLGQAHEMIF